MRLWIIALLLAFAWMGLLLGLFGIPTWTTATIALFVFEGLALGLAVVLAIRVVKGAWRGFRARLRGEKKAAPTLQTTLFRVVLIALLGVFLAVTALDWYSKRQEQLEEQSNQPFSSAEEARAQLEIAYWSQPLKQGSDVPMESDLYQDGTGLWIDAAAYERVRAVVDLYERDGRGSSGQLLLSGREMYPLRDIVPPSVYREWRRTGLPNLWNRGYAFPVHILPQKQTLRTLVDKGYVVGRTRDSDNEQWVRYAFWRTGPDTAYYGLHARSPRREGGLVVLERRQLELAGDVRLHPSRPVRGSRGLVSQSPDRPAGCPGG